MCRCLLTYYENDPVGYVGFFEARNNLSAVRELFQSVYRKAQADGKNRLIGPIDASIYVNYRFKVNRFDKTYTGEPYNKSYYPALWEKCGFDICDKYVSNQLRKVEDNDSDVRLERIYMRYLNKGYQFVSPTAKDFAAHLHNVYYLMMELYSGFSGYKYLSESQFIQMFAPIKKILNFDMVKLAYKDGELQAFCIAIPNYGALTKGKMSFSKLLKIYKIRKKPSEYVILYLGANRSSVGLGSALIHHIRNILNKNQCTSIGALIKEGNLTGELYKDLYVDKFNYVLFEKSLVYRSDENGNINNQ
jgi:hypothetical protein